MAPHTSDPFTALVVSGGLFQGLALLKGLKQNSRIRIVLADCSEDIIGIYFADAFHQVPPVTDRVTFLDSLIQICREEGVRVLFPATQHELLPLVLAADRFRREGVEMAMADLPFLETFGNKRAFSRFLVEHGLPTLTELDPMSPGLPFPIIGKLLCGCGGRGNIVVRTPEEFQERDLGRIASDYHWQPYLEDFEEFSLDFAIGFDGNISPPVCRLRVRTSAGFAVIADGAPEPDVLGTASSLLGLLPALGGRGIFNLQIIRKGGACYLTDLNCRIGTSAVFANRAGVNLPLFVCGSLVPGLHPRLPDMPPARPLRMVRYLEEIWIERSATKDLRGVVFDLDDTLFDQKRWILAKLALLWDEERDSLPPREAFLRAGLRAIEEGWASRLFDHLIQVLGLDEARRERLIIRYRQLEPQGEFLIGGVVRVLKTLRARGYRLAILTDNPPASQAQKIGAAALEPLVDAVVFSMEHGDEKPSANGFHVAGRALGLPPAELVMVGDNPHRDVIGALEAGYGEAFWVPRQQGFFGYDGPLFEELTGLKLEWRRLGDITRLLWCLPDYGLSNRAP